MELKVEQIESDINLMTQQAEQLKAQWDRTLGALAVLKNIKAHLEKKEEVPVEEVLGTEISDVNKAVQDALEARQEALVEEPQMKVDAYGKYGPVDPVQEVA